MVIVVGGWAYVGWISGLFMMVFFVGWLGVFVFGVLVGMIVFVCYVVVGYWVYDGVDFDLVMLFDCGFGGVVVFFVLDDV